MLRGRGKVAAFNGFKYPGNAGIARRAGNAKLCSRRWQATAHVGIVQGVAHGAALFQATGTAHAGEVLAILEQHLRQIRERAYFGET